MTKARQVWEDTPEGNMEEALSWQKNEEGSEILACSVVLLKCLTRLDFHSSEMVKWKLPSKRLPMIRSGERKG